MNFIKNLIASIKNFFVRLHDVTRDATTTVAAGGFKNAGWKKSIIALAFWVALAVVMFFSFKVAFGYMALETTSGFLMYVFVRTLAHGVGFFTTLYMLAMLGKSRLA